LVEHILGQIQARAPGGPSVRLSDEALAALGAHEFPGNVRELWNVIERAVVLAEGPVIGAAELPLPRSPAPRSGPGLDAVVPSLEGGWASLQAYVKEMERQLLDRAMDVWRDHSNEEIARLLGTSRRVLELRLQEHGLRKKG
jgi:DNA-binding NtrC family response regulator